ncbi:hypothetical protein [Longitalea luteola]|uniref:hypothetical protein n=1 Tax=Longitalea luteola TaxID=2812563 RepID=UPI001A963F2B|nr:hypothetical protein [Longitalea luteola]
MKKLLIGALVGGIILFMWQFLSWTVLNLHYNAYQYTPKQDAIMSTLSAQLEKEGQYMMPSLPPDAPMEEHEQFMKTMEGKPWALVQYHQSMSTNMGSNMIRGLIVNMLIVAFFCTIISRMNALNFTAIFISALFVGMIVFFNVPYTNHIWFKGFDLMAYFIDSIVSWALVGIWLGWLYGRKKA